MARILLTAFEPYEPWKTNASWLALIELTSQLEATSEITTRLYPVELSAMKAKLAIDLKTQYDFVFHIGQAPKSSCIQLEEYAVNIATAGKTLEDIEASTVVCESGPPAYQSQLPLQAFARALRDEGIPARVSFHAGTFLCNAILYWSRQLIDDLDLPTKSTFIHVPLDTSQVLELDDPTAFMPKSMVVEALKKLLALAKSELHESVDQVV